MILRDYQEDVVAKTIKKLKEKNSVLTVSPTGSGKTIMIAAMIERYLEGDKIESEKGSSPPA